MVSDDIFKSLNMTHSSYSQPPDTTFGLIPINESASGWSVPQGDESPWATSQILSEKRNSADFYHSAGSVFTSTNDLARAGRSILGSSLLSPAQTRRWLKPVTHTSDPYESVGHPWEILRIQDPDNRITDLYTKDGDVGLYSTSLILSPDHNIGLTVLVGGTGSDQERTTLVNSLINGFLPAIEDEARQQASNRFSGTYIASGNSSKTSFIIATDDRPGLGLFNATTINGTPLQLIAESQGLGSKNQTLSVRLYPTGLKTTATTADGKGTYTSRMSFRATFEALPQPFIRGWCQTWVSLDGFLYGGVGADEFVFGFAEGGDVAYVDWRALRERLVKSG